MRLGGVLPELRGSAFLRGAHHPHCPAHASHLLWFAGRPLCLGCTCVAAGFAVGVGVSLAGWLDSLGPIAWAALHVALVLPTALQPWVQRKPFKVGARTALGLATATWLVGPARTSRLPLPSVVEFGLAVAILVALAAVLLALRDRKTTSPCLACPQGSYPTCEWNLPRLMAAADDPVLAEALASLRADGRPPGRN